jgi:metal-responsive CopG/Arc/MetJ family transcriptional regulator
MKSKTSITLSTDVLRRVDRLARRGESRSATIERILVEGLAERERRASNDRDRALIDAHADALNAETADVLGYQGDV